MSDLRTDHHVSQRHSGTCASPGFPLHHPCPPASTDTVGGLSHAESYGGFKSWAGDAHAEFHFAASRAYGKSLPSSPRRWLFRRPYSCSGTPRAIHTTLAAARFRTNTPGESYSTATSVGTVFPWK